MIKISIIGFGFVGSAMYKSFENKGFLLDENIFLYDKYKNGGIGSIENILLSSIVFLALPTIYNEELCSYDLDPIYECCNYLSTNDYDGTIVIKSTVEPGTISQLESIYPNLNFVHNPEFLTARTAYEDFNNQTHIVLGKGLRCSNKNFSNIKNFYSQYYPDAFISECLSTESETMKIFCNSFYAVKVQFFTELYLLCKNINCDYDTVKKLMLNNNWINPMHTNIPGPDGNISYGGLCFPKDTNALNEFMKKNLSPNLLLEACIQERNEMRGDNDNIKKQKEDNFKLDA